MLLAGEPRIDVGDLAVQAGLPADRVRAALTRLGTAGRVGYDTAEAAYFHRELPYHAARAELSNPRLRDALALVRGGAVTLDATTAAVRSRDNSSWPASGTGRYAAGSDRTSSVESANDTASASSGAARPRRVRDPHRAPMVPTVHQRTAPGRQPPHV